MAKIEDILKDLSGKGGLAAFRGGGLSSAAIVKMTKDIEGLEKQLKKAALDKNFKRINIAYEQMGRIKTFSALSNKLKKAQKEFKKLTSAQDAFTDPKKAKEIRNQAAAIGKLEKEASDLKEEFEDINRTLLGKGWNRLKELGTSKWASFASGTVAVGFFVNGLRNIDKASIFVKESLRNIPIDEVAARYDTLGLTVNENAGILEKYSESVQSIFAVKKEWAKETVNAVYLQEKLRAAVLSTGKSLGDLTITSIQIARTFRINATESTEAADKLAKFTERSEQLARVLNIDASESVRFMEDRVKRAGTSMEDATLIMGRMVMAANDLQKSNEGLKLSTNDFGRAVMRSTESDVRYNQNTRIKIQLIKNTIDQLVKQGRTQKEAMAAGENAAATAIKGSKTIENLTGISLATRLEADAKMLDSMKKRGATEEEIEAKRVEVIAKYTVGMSKTQAESAEKRLKRELELAKDGIRDKFSLGQKLNDMLGSAEMGMVERARAQRKLYGKIDRNTAIKLMREKEGMDWAVAETRFDLMQKGEKAYLDTVRTRQVDEKKGIEDIDKAAKVAAQAGTMEALFNLGKDILNNPAVNFVLAGLAAGATALTAGGIATAAGGVLSAGGATAAGGALLKAGGAATALGSGALATGGVLAAGAGGYAVGMGIDKLADVLTTKVDQFGQKSNIFERGIGRIMTALPKSLGGITSQQYQEMYGTVAPPAGTKPPPTVAAPTSPSNVASQGPIRARYQSTTPGGEGRLLIIENLNSAVANQSLDATKQQ